MQLQKALENGIPDGSFDTDIGENPMDDAIRRGLQQGEADDSIAFRFAYSWIQRLLRCVREAIRLLSAEAGFQVRSGCCERSPARADNEVSSRAPASKTTTEQS
jgi:hypothetical protein